MGTGAKIDEIFRRGWGTGAKIDEIFRTGVGTGANFLMRFFFFSFFFFFTSEYKTLINQRSDP